MHTSDYAVSECTLFPAIVPGSSGSWKEIVFLHPALKTHEMVAFLLETQPTYISIYIQIYILMEIIQRFLFRIRGALVRAQLGPLSPAKSVRRRWVFFFYDNSLSHHIDHYYDRSRWTMPHKTLNSGMSIYFVAAIILFIQDVQII